MAMYTRRHVVASSTFEKCCQTLDKQRDDLTLLLVHAELQPGPARALEHQAVLLCAALSRKMLRLATLRRPGAIAALHWLNFSSQVHYRLCHHASNIRSEENGRRPLVLRGTVGREHAHLQRMDEVSEELLVPFCVICRRNLATLVYLEVRVRRVPRACVTYDDRPHRRSRNEG